MAPKPPFLLLWNTLILVNVVASGSTDLEPKLHFTYQPQDVVVTRNERLVLNCSAVDDAGQEVNITWRKDGELLNDRRRYVLPDGSLLIRRVLGRKGLPEKNDEGVYECLARNPIGTIASRKFRITIANLSPFSGEPQSSTVSVGELAQFECQAVGTPAPNITWEKHRETLPQDSRYTTLTSGVLQIRDVQLSDAGYYRCRAANGAREARHSTEALLTVLSAPETKAPKLLSGPKHVSKVEGDSVVMQCAITAIPSCKVVWLYADGREVTGSRTKLLGGSNLLIEDLQLEDEGVYHCAVEQPGQDRIVLAQARLTILVAPKVIHEPTDLVKARAYTTRFICGFSGHPLPTVRWLKNGQPIKHNGRIKIKEHNFYGKERMLGDGEVGTMLVLWQTITSDSGLYQCQAENEAGQTSVTMRLYVEPSDDSPEPPGSLTAHPVKDSSSKIDLTWVASPRKNGHEILAYSVHYLPTKGGAELQKVDTGTSVTIDQLMPHTNYTFYVVAYNEMSASEHSHTATAVTGEDVPVAAPWVTVTPEGSTLLKVSWSPLDVRDARGDISQYRVIYRKHGGTTEHHEEVPGNVLEYTITGLLSSQKYDVRVVGGTSLGYPALVDEDWPWVTQVTDPDRNIGAPGPPNMQVQALNSSAILVVWEQPPLPEGMELMGYKLNFNKLDEPKRTIIVFDDVTSHILMRLDGDSWYEINLFAFNRMGEGEAVVKSVKTPLPSESSVVTTVTPPPPQHVEAEPLNATSIAIQWKKPPFTNPVTRYTVRYNAVMVKGGREVRNVSQVKYISSEKMEALVSGLDAFTMYEFSVRSHTSDMEGQYSSEIRCRTLEGMPSAPLNPHYVLYGPSTIQLHWEPPAKSNGIIQSYIILYSDDNMEDETQWHKHKENGTITQTLVKDLDASNLYFFKLRAATRQGEGDSSPVLQVELRRAMNPGSQEDRPRGYGAAGPTNNEKEMGIIVGACIGGGCIIICAIIILLRNKCFPPRLMSTNSSESYAGHNGSLPYMNGNGYIPTALDHHIEDGNHEMDHFLPHIANLSENENSDSKGGTDVFYRQGGKVNGIVPVNGVRVKSAVPVNGVRNNHMLNGRLKRYPGRERYNSCTSSEDGPEVPLRSTSLCDAPTRGVRSEADLTLGETVGANVNNGCSLNETNVDVSSDCGMVDVDTCSTDCEAHSPQDCNTGSSQGSCAVPCCHTPPSPPRSIPRQGVGQRRGPGARPPPSPTSHSSLPTQCLSQGSSPTPPQPMPTTHHWVGNGRSPVSGYSRQQQQRQQGLPTSQQQQQQQQLSSFLPRCNRPAASTASLPQSESQGSHCQRLSPKADRANQPHQARFSQDNADLQAAVSRQART